jgi:hypothetical protein
MFKLFLSLVFISIIACNTKSKTTPAAATSDSAASAYTWNNDDEKEFLAGCVENARTNLGDTAAYKQCNCVLRQLKQKYPNLDSAANHLTDSTEVAAYTANCK